MTKTNPAPTWLDEAIEFSFAKALSNLPSLERFPQLPADLDHRHAGAVGPLLFPDEVGRKGLLLRERRFPN